MSGIESQTFAEQSDFERALGKALKFSPVDLTANRNGDLGLNQRLRLLVRGSLLLLLVVILATLTAIVYVSLGRSNVNAAKPVFLIVVVDLAVFLVVGTRGVSSAG